MNEYKSKRLIFVDDDYNISTNRKIYPCFDLVIRKYSLKIIIVGVFASRIIILLKTRTKKIGKSHEGRNFLIAIEIFSMFCYVLSKVDFNSSLDFRRNSKI